MKQGLFALFILAAAVIVNGCAGSKSGNVADSPGNGLNGGCQANTYPSQFGCKQQGFCGVGQVEHLNACYPIQKTFALQYSGDIQITNTAVFEKYLEMTTRLCSTTARSGVKWGVIHYNIGGVACSVFSQSGRVTIGTNSPSLNDGAPAALRIGGGNYVSGPFIESEISTSMRAINNNQGFVLQDYSQFSYPTGRIQAVANGSLSGATFNVSLRYNNVEFAIATVTRW